MSDYEILKECKQAYEILNDLKDNCADKTIIELNNISLEYLYQKAYETLLNEKYTYENVKTNIKCPHCNSELFISDIIGYAYVCKECDENFYYSECDLGESWWNK